MNDIMKKLKKHLEEMNNKKFINNLFIILLVTIIFLVGVNFFLTDKKEASIPTKEVVETKIDNSDYTYYLEKKMESILAKLKGVGEVSVMITLEDTSEKFPAANTNTTIETTKEVDAEGGIREVNREDTSVQMVSKSNDGTLVVLKEANPTVKGVIVVAEGAEDIVILENLYQAVKTVLGISGNKVQVYSSK